MQVVISNLPFRQNLVYSFLLHRHNIGQSATRKDIADSLGLDRTKGVKSALTKLVGLGLAKDLGGRQGFTPLPPPPDKLTPFTMKKTAHKDWWQGFAFFSVPLMTALSPLNATQNLFYHRLKHLIAQQTAKGRPGWQCPKKLANTFLHCSTATAVKTIKELGELHLLQLADHERGGWLMTIREAPAEWFEEQKVKTPASMLPVVGSWWDFAKPSQRERFNKLSNGLPERFIESTITECQAVHEGNGKGQSCINLVNYRLKVAQWKRNKKQAFRIEQERKDQEEIKAMRDNRHKIVAMMDRLGFKEWQPLCLCKEHEFFVRHQIVGWRMQRRTRPLTESDHSILVDVQKTHPDPQYTFHDNVWECAPRFTDCTTNGWVRCLGVAIGEDRYYFEVESGTQEEYNSGFKSNEVNNHDNNDTTNNNKADVTIEDISGDGDDFLERLRQMG